MRHWEELLLDTHVLLSAVLEPHKLNQGLPEALESSETALLISAASAWGIATKWRLGKLPVAPQSVITALLPAHNRHPLDRLLIAQTHAETYRPISSSTWLIKAATSALQTARSRCCGPGSSS